MNADLVAAQLEEFRAALAEVNANLDAASEAFERAKASHDAEGADFTTRHTRAVRDAARVVDEKWATARRENVAGYADVTCSLNATKDAFARVAQANAAGVLERDEETRAFGDAFRSFERDVRAELAFQEKAAAWPESAMRDFLEDVEEDKRVVAVLSLERIDEAHRESRRARRDAFRETLGDIATAIDRAREADGERVRAVKERAEVWDRRLGIDRGIPSQMPNAKNKTHLGDPGREMMERRRR